MSLMRKVSLAYRMSRAAKKAEAAQKANIIHMQRFQDALRLGMIKVPVMKMPLVARMVEPRAELHERVPGFGLSADMRRYGKKPYELKTPERKLERNKYAGYYSPGTWAENYHGAE